MKVRFHVSTKYVGSQVKEVIDIPDEDVEDLDEVQRDKVIQEYYMDWLWNNIESGWSIEE